MRRDNPLKHFAIAFAIAIAVYLVFYNGIEHRRTRKGPWQVTFTNAPSGEPQIVINQPALAISNQVIRFSGETNAATGTLNFSEPRPVPYPVPFGRCVFMDTTFLPGTLTLQLFGHEIELIPRVMTIDHREHPWNGTDVIVLESMGRAGAR